MEMCYDGALVMPSSYAVMNKEEMTYVDGGKTINMYNVPCNAAKSYLSSMQIQCRAGAIAAGVNSVAAAAIPIVAYLLTPASFVTASVLWSWAEAYGSANNTLSQLMSGKRNRVRKVNITERTSGFTLSVNVARAS